MLPAWQLCRSTTVGLCHLFAVDADHCPKNGVCSFPVPLCGSAVGLAAKSCITMCRSSDAAVSLDSWCRQGRYGPVPRLTDGDCPFHLFEPLRLCSLDPYLLSTNTDAAKSYGTPRLLSVVGNILINHSRRQHSPLVWNPFVASRLPSLVQRQSPGPQGCSVARYLFSRLIVFAPLALLPLALIHPILDRPAAGAFPEREVPVLGWPQTRGVASARYRALPAPLPRSCTNHHP
ncbi:hypothetical protein EDB81DRAFT_142946 [Dactylonectria macrodidyma]|uniref:Uncharacterized protein n=1 Tax=Dactylonectria macrodidyma TaxID=307937 RepID=A0A9P9DWE2_9HYPO|nr:hypothetical protein EDB81DRAFT_142946 [Dactylonectria macrodidyma]